MSDAASTETGSVQFDHARWGDYPEQDRAELVLLANRRAFDSDLAAGHQAANAEEPFSLLMIDVDHFKRVNDTYGHPGGDCILIGVSNCVRKIVGRRGRAYRYGGEELVVLLPHFAAEEAFYVAERIRRAIAITVWKHDDRELRVTISIGVATTPHSTTASHEALLKAADTALYKAKHGGRNRTCLAEGIAPEPAALTPPTPGDREQHPDLRGTWQGKLHSGWVDPNTNLRQEPREVFMSIKQTDATLHMRLLTTESQSVSLAAAIVQAADGQWSLNSVYRNEPGHSARHRSPIHHGGMILRVGGPPPTSMSGDYWTDRSTQGEIALWLVSREPSDDYATAHARVAAGGQPTP